MEHSQTTHVLSPQISPKSHNHFLFVMPTSLQTTCPGCVESIPESVYNRLHETTRQIASVDKRMYKVKKDLKRINARVGVLRLQRSRSQHSSVQRASQLKEAGLKIRTLGQQLVWYQESKTALKIRQQGLRQVWGRQFAERMDWGFGGTDAFHGDVAMDVQPGSQYWHSLEECNTILAAGSSQ
jgi:septal ring factor EnvC (AmiA/AmiB activator)